MQAFSAFYPTMYSIGEQDVENGGEKTHTRLNKSPSLQNAQSNIGQVPCLLPFVDPSWFFIAGTAAWVNRYRHGVTDESLKWGWGTSTLR